MNFKYAALHLFLASVLSTSASAEVFRSRPIPGSQFSFAAEPEITLTGDEDFTLFLHGGYGFGGGYALNMKVGLGQSPFNDDDLHISGMLDFSLIQSRNGKVGIFMGLGVSNWGDVSIENQVVLFGDVGPFILYTGLDDALRFQDNAAGDDVRFPVEWVFGLEAPLRKTMHLIMEGGYELHESSSYISGGIRLFF